MRYWTVRRIKNGFMRGGGLLVLLFIMVACGAQKGAHQKIGPASLSVQKIIERFDHAKPEFRTLVANMKGSLDDGKEKQSVQVSLRIKKDDTIWASAKLLGLIPLAKLMITPNHVQFYEKIHGRFYDGDFELLSRWLGTSVNFEEVQNLLLGNPLKDVDAEEFTGSMRGDAYILKAKEHGGITKDLAIDSKRFRLKQQKYEERDSNRSLMITYPSYTRESNFTFPEKMNIIVNQSGKQLQVHLDYRNLNFNRSVRFPFRIPSGYQEITLK